MVDKIEVTVTDLFKKHNGNQDMKICILWLSTSIKMMEKN